MQAVGIGLMEFPADASLLALEDQVRKGQERGTRALEMVAKARESADRGAYDEALATLREARNLDPRNTVILTVLVNSLLEQAKRIVDSDWQSAEVLVRELLRLVPNHPQAPWLVSRIKERMAGAPPPAVAPAPPPSVPPPSAPATVRPPTPSGYPPQSSLPDQPTVSQPAAAIPDLFTAPVPKEPEAQKPAAQTIRPAPPPPKKPAAGPKTGQTKKLLIGTGVAAGVLLVIALGVNLSRHRKPASPPPPSHYAIVIHSSPEGAEIKFNGDTCGTSTCNKDVPPGTYQATAQLTGYQNAALSVTVGPGTAKDFNLTLAPQATQATIFTDLTDGTVSLDEAPAGQIQGGGAEVPNLAPGKHVLAVKGGDSAASIPIEIAPGVAPKLDGSIDAKNVRCFVVAGFGGEAHLYGNGTGYRVTLDGKPLGNLGADGIPLTGLSPGTHELAFDSAAGQHDRMAFESQPSASLYVTLGTAQNLGVLTVETNEDQAHLLINGQKYKRDTARGRLVLSLFPKKYTVTVQKDGFAPAVEQTVEVKRGVETKVSFTLTPAKGILAIHHAPPGTDVAVDSISRGTAHGDGEFQVGGIDPGRHTVTLRHDGFKPMQTEQTFGGGKTVDVQGTLESAPVTGTLRFEIGPPGLDAHVRIRRDGDAQDREVTGTSVTVPEGHYVVSVSAPQYSPASASVQVNAGGTAPVAITLRRLEAPKPVKTAPTIAFGLEDWLKLPGWANQNGLLVHKGGDWVMASPEIAQGTIRFTVVSLKGKHVEWAVAYRDEKNFLHYELDDKNLTRYELKNGSKSGQLKVPHGLDKKKPMSISIAVTPQSVVLDVSLGGWLDLDKWDRTGAPVNGKFGFRIPGSDEIGLQDFTITPN
jgi:hypothetical protein